MFFLVKENASNWAIIVVNSIKLIKFSIYPVLLADM